MPHSFALFANEWVLRMALVIEFFHRTMLDFQRPFLKVHTHQLCLTGEVRAKAAPLPLLWKVHQFTIRGNTLVVLR